MNILALDLSTKSSGYAIFEDATLKAHGCVTSSSTDLIKRIYIMRNAIDELLTNNEIDKIVVEEVRPEGGYGVGNQKTMKALMYLQAALEFLIHDNHNKVTIEYVYPSSWRASCGIKNGRGIKRTSLKEADIQFVKDTYGVSVGDDEADAICIGHAQFNQKSNEINWE